MNRPFVFRHSSAMVARSSGRSEPRPFVNAVYYTRNVRRAHRLTVQSFAYTIVQFQAETIDWGRLWANFAQLPGSFGDVIICTRDSESSQS
jgi:short subunit dehydrogenase-like uncharacterized protein